MAAQASGGARRRREGRITLLLVALNLFALNVLSEHHYVRWDLTEDHRYTLSPETRRVLGSLDDVVMVKYFVSRDLPPNGRELRSRTKDLLDEFRDAAGGRLQVVCLDPSGDFEVRAEAQQYGIPELPLQQYGADSYEAKMAYLGIAALYEDRVETVPIVLDTANLEYDLLMCIVRVLRKERPVVAFYQRSGGAAPEDLPPELRAQWSARRGPGNRHDIGRDYSRAAKDLEKQYRVEVVDLSTPVPERVATLVAANTEGMDETAWYHLDQFIMRGGKVLFLVPGVTVNLDRMQARSRDEHLDPFLAHYGIRVEKNLVLDYPRCAAVQVTREVGGRSMAAPRPYPPFLLIGPEEMDRENPITRNLRNLTLAFCSSLHLDSTEGARARVLLRSSPGAWTVSEPFHIDPEEIRPPGEGARASYDLAGFLEGEFISYYAARSVPEEVVNGDEEDQGVENGGDLHHPPGIRLRSPPTTIMVIGSDAFLSNSVYGGTTAVFFANAVDYLTLGEGFGGIRSRRTDLRLIDPRFREDLGTVKRLKVAGTLGGGVLILLLGGLLSLRRRIRRKREGFSR